MQKIKKILSSLLAFIFVLTVVFGANISTVKADTTTNKLIIHYCRFDSSYSNWNLWVWNLDDTGVKLTPPYNFSSEDSYGEVATINLDSSIKKVGLIVRKGNWEAKDVDADRSIAINGDTEVWLLQDDATIYATKPTIKPKMKVFADGDNYLRLKLQKTVDLAQSNLKDQFKIFKNGTAINVEKIENGNVPLKDDGKTPEERGYITTDGATKVKFVLQPGKFGFPANTDGNAKVYVSGGMNDWGGTSGPKAAYQELPDWKMSWDTTNNEYILEKSLDGTSGNVAVGQNFKFTWIDNDGKTVWGDMPDTTINKLGSALDTNTDFIKLTLSQDVDVTANYKVQLDGYYDSNVTMRNVLDSSKYYYAGSDLGTNYSKYATTLKVWAPTATLVKARVYDSAEDTAIHRDYKMYKYQNGTWATKLKGNMNGKYYTYIVNVNVNGEKKTYEVADPYSNGTSANSKRTLIYDDKEVNNSVSGWSNDNYVSLKNNVDAVLYEAHVRDFSVDKSSGISEQNRGKYLAFTETGAKTPAGKTSGIDYLKELGVTHVHLLPTFDYGTGDETTLNTKYDWYNWGYDPVLYNNVEGSYATNPNGTARQIEYKKMVKSLHDNGIGLVTDVVFNHTISTGGESDKSIFDKIVPGYYYRVDDNGKYSNASGCGNELASDKPMVSKLILDSVKYWLKEYHVDGLRFDLMAALDTNTMKKVYDAAKNINPNVIIYGEGWNGGTSILDPDLMANKANLAKINEGTRNLAVFNDEIREDVKGNNDGDVKGFAQSGTFRNGEDRFKAEIKGASSFVTSPNQTVNYGSAHDNLDLYDKMVKSMSTSTTEEVYKKASNLANAIILTSQGIPFIQQGTEFARTKSASATPNNTYNSVVGNDIDWNLRDKNSDMVDYYKGLIALRKAHPAFRMTNATEVNNAIEFVPTHPDGVEEYVIKGNANGDTWKNILVVYNGSDTEKKIKVTGNWTVVVKDNKAGVDKIEDVKDEVTVPAYSALVAYTDGDYKFVDDSAISYMKVNVGDYKLYITSPEVKSTDAVYMVGSFNGWKPGDPNYQLIKQNDGSYKVSGSINATDEYKFIRGNDWSFVERTFDGNNISNRTIGNAKLQNILIQKWTDRAQKIETSPLKVVNVKSGDYSFNLTLPIDTVVNNIYMVGDCNNWTVNDETYRLNKVDDIDYTTVGSVYQGQLYKFVLNGTWDNGEQIAGGKDFNNRRIGAIKQQDITIEGFKGFKSFISPVWDDGKYIDVKVGDYTLKVYLPESTLDTDDIYMPGGFNDWKLDDTSKLVKQADGTYVVAGSPKATDEYKFVRGTAWTAVEVITGGNRVFGNEKNQIAQVLRWDDK